MKTKVFSKNNCMQCKMVKRLLTESNVDFEEVNIDNDPAAMSYLKEHGFQTVPVTQSESATIVGFRPDQLRALA